MNEAIHLHNVLDKIIEAEREAGKLIIEAQGIMAEAKTSTRDLVTEYDRKVQNLLIERLKKAIPDACFFCEEQEKKDDINADRLFIIDPIDGTMNFVRNLHHSCISVAYAEHGEIKSAAIYNPYVDEMFTATHHGGAFLNGKSIRAENVPLKDTVVCFGTNPYDVGLASYCFFLTQKVFESCLDVRREGSAALDICSVAAGRAGLFYELALSPWDYAAGMLIARESGCVCCTIDGDVLKLGNQRSSVVVGGETTVKDFMSLHSNAKLIFDFNK